MPNLHYVGMVKKRIATGIYIPVAAIPGSFSFAMTTKAKPGIQVGWREAP